MSWTYTPRGLTPQQRFFMKVKKTEFCWEWIASKYRCGYGKMQFNGKYQPSHRISWQLHFGEIPEDMHICHKCDNKICVKPGHLFLGTRQDNMDDMVIKKRSARHENHNCAKLTFEKVKEMRNIYSNGNISYSKIGKKFGVAGSVAFHAIKGNTWKE